MAKQFKMPSKITSMVISKVIIWLPIKSQGLESLTSEMWLLLSPSLQKTIESETAKTSEVLKKKLEELTDTVKEVSVSGEIYAVSFAACFLTLTLWESDRM